MFTMAGVSIILLVAFSVTVAMECPRKVDVFMEIRPDKINSILKSNEGKRIFKSLYGNGGSGNCWQSTIRVIDTHSSSVRSVDCATENCVALTQPPSQEELTPRKYIAKELKSLASDTGDNFIPADRASIVLLILDNEDMNVDAIDDAANDLLELGYRFITVGVGEGWLEKDFKNIALQTYRIFLVNKISDIDPGLEYGANSGITSLLRYPDAKPTINTMDVPMVGESFPEAFNPMSSLPTLETIEKKCDVSVDLGFVLDSSGSLKYDFDREKYFIKMIAKAFNVKKGATHAGVVSFSHKAELSIRLSQTTTYDKFRDAVSAIRYMDSYTRIDLALKLARDQLFAKEFGGRKGKKKVLVILTDGSQSYDDRLTDVVDPAIISDELRKADVEILVIGIGNQIKEEELTELAGPKDNYRHARDFIELTSREFAANITTKICDIVITEECERIVDICFLLDSSGSINKDTDWETMKSFVRRLANVFQFSETGAHGSVVVFSDRISDKNAYSKVTIKLNNGLSASDFGRQLQDTPYIGWRTRIDLGFNLIENDVFTVKNGARPHVKRVIILITDGRQYPTNYDPVAASRKLYDQGVNIYAIGIGKRINFNQLNRITRKRHRVFKADSFSYLENSDFVKSVSKTVCRNSSIPRPATACCPKMTDDFKSKMGKKLVELVKSELDTICGAKDVKVGVVGRPAVVSSPRKRRSVNMNHINKEDVDIEDNGFEQLGVLSKYTKMAGCNLFLNALRKYGLLKTISDLMREDKQVSIFCPVDKAYEKLLARKDLAANERNILLHHIGLKDNNYGRVYRTLLPGGQILLNAVTKESGKMSWKANDAETVDSFVHGTGSEIIVVNDILLPTVRNLLDVLKSNINVSIFYDLLVKSQLTDIFKKAEIEKICFTQDMCLTVTPAMFDQIRAAVNLKQFTICAPTNGMLLNMKKTQVKLLMANDTARKEFLQEYLFLGSLASPSSNGKEVGYSLSPKHFVLTPMMKKNGMVLKHADGRKFQVKDTILATEGIVHLIEMAI